MFASKNLRITKKDSRADLIKKKGLTRSVKTDACAASKHKIILLWPKVYCCL